MFCFRGQHHRGESFQQAPRFAARDVCCRCRWSVWLKLRACTSNIGGSTKHFTNTLPPRSCVHSKEQPTDARARVYAHTQADTPKWNHMLDWWAVKTKPRVHDERTRTQAHGQTSGTTKLYSSTSNMAKEAQVGAVCILLRYQQV